MKDPLTQSQAPTDPVAANSNPSGLMNRKSLFTRREFLWLSSATSVAMAQGVSTRNVKPQRKGKPSGLPFHCKFTDIAAQAGLIHPIIYGGVTQKNYIVETVGCGVAFLDYDRDGHLDLFVANYVDLHPERLPKPGANPFCNYKGVPVNCGPRGLPMPRNYLYRNQGDGTFRDISVEAGITRAEHTYSMTTVAADFNGDGWSDIYVACDSTPSLLFRNAQNGTFVEEG